MGARLRAAFVAAAAAALTVISAPGASAEDPIGGPLLTGSTVAVQPNAGVPNPPTVDAGSFVLADADTGEIFAAKAPHERLRPASTLKMLTAITLLPLLDLEDEYTATYEDDAEIGSAVGIVEGQTYTIDQLFMGLFLASGNDAAHALANAAGGVAETVELMRQEAERIQALDTTPENPSGLDSDGQLSSAYDLALIGRTGLQIEAFREYAATENARFPTKDGDSTYEITNHNKLLGAYDGAIGIKNGYTRASGYTFVGAASRNGRTLIVSLMNGEPDVHREAARLMDWGFQYAGAVDPVGVLVDPVPDEPLPTPSPSAAAAAGDNGEGDRTPAGGLQAPLAAGLGAIALLLGGVGTAILVRRVRRRRALRAELVHWATMRQRPIGYGPSPRRQPRRPPSQPPPRPPRPKPATPHGSSIAGPPLRPPPPGMRGPYFPPHAPGSAQPTRGDAGQSAPRPERRRPLPPPKELRELPPPQRPGPQRPGPQRPGPQRPGPQRPGPPRQWPPDRPPDHDGGTDGPPRYR